VEHVDADPNFLDLWMKRGAHAREIAFFYFPRAQPGAILRRFTTVPGMHVGRQTNGRLGNLSAAVVAAEAVPPGGRPAFDLLTVTDAAGVEPPFPPFFVRGEHVGLVVARASGGTIMATMEALEAEYPAFERHVQPVLDSVRVG
jgi:hypothetical protein